MNERETKAVRVLVFGLVQGVFFRVSARNEALRLGLTGWVRNRRDGSVEAFFQGPPEAVERAVAWCRRGPTGARVETVEVSETPPDGRYVAGFSVVKDLPG
jgi:acylphosphatase